MSHIPLLLIKSEIFEHDHPLCRFIFFSFRRGKGRKLTSRLLSSAQDLSMAQQDSATRRLLKDMQEVK